MSIEMMDFPTSERVKMPNRLHAMLELARCLEGDIGERA
jgi:hypothetical protein